MPVHEVKKQGKLVGYQWGSSGKIYLIKVFGKIKAKMYAEKQGRAIYASGYK